MSRLKTELRLAFPDREYSVRLKGETLQIGRKAEKPRFRLKSPVLGEWVVRDTSGRDEEFVSFIDAVDEIIALETLLSLCDCLEEQAKPRKARAASLGFY